MSARRPLRLLIVTPLDLVAMPGNVEHARLAVYSAQGHDVSAVYKTLNRSRGLGRFLRDTFTVRTRVTQSPEGALVSVDPFFNYFAGLRKNADEQESGARSSGGLRRALLRLLSPLGALRDLAFVPCATWATRRLDGRFDACLGIGPWGSSVGRRLARSGRVRCVVYVDRDYEPGLVPDRLRRFLTSRSERRNARRADAVVSVGRRLAALRESQSGRAPEVLPNGVDWERFETARASRDKRSGPPVLLYVGNVVSWSGLEHALEALARLDGVRLRVVGSGLPGYLEHLRTRAEQLAIGERVEWLGARPHDELPALMAAADIGLANSEPVEFRRYACPLKVMEYMAAGLPCVVTVGTEAADMVERSGGGVAVPYDARALATALSTLLRDDARRRAIGRRGAEWAEGMTWERLLASEIELIERCLDEGVAR